MLLWAGLMVLASVGARLIGDTFDLGWFATDSIGGGVWLVVALICRYESGSWWSFLWTLIPFYGYIHSFRCFWRLPETPQREITGSRMSPAPTLGHD